MTKAKDGDRHGLTPPATRAPSEKAIANALARTSLQPFGRRIGKLNAEFAFLSALVANPRVTEERRLNASIAFDHLILDLAGIRAEVAALPIDHAAPRAVDTQAALDRLQQALIVAAAPVS